MSRSNAIPFGGGTCVCVCVWCRIILLTYIQKCICNCVCFHWAFSYQLNQTIDCLDTFSKTYTYTHTHPRHWNITKFGVNVRHGLTLTNLATPIDSRSSRSFYSLLLLFLFALLTRRLQLKSSLHFSIEVRSWSYIWWDWCSNHHTHIHTTWTDHSVCVCLCILYHGLWQH